MDLRDADIAEDRRFDVPPDEWLRRLAILDDDEGIVVRDRVVAIAVIDHERLVLAIELAGMTGTREAFVAVAPKGGRHQHGQSDPHHAPIQHWLIHIGCSDAGADHFDART